MKEAEEKLKEAQRQGAAEKQEEAIRELNRPRPSWRKSSANSARRRSSGCWRCSRPASARCCKCRRRSTKARVRLDKVPAAERTHNHEIEASRLSGKESQIVVEVDKAALLLREDGSAVAFPEAVEQMRDDMQQVVERLAQAKVGKITQGIEEDIIAALKEMIEALKKAQKDQDNKTAAGPAGAGPAARAAAGRRAGRAEDDPRPANAGQHPHRPVLENDRRRAGRQRRTGRGAAAARRARTADPPRHPRPANGEEPMNRSNPVMELPDAANASCMDV